MSGTAPSRAAQRSEAYPARLLVEPQVDAHGVVHGPWEQRSRLGWDEVRAAHAAEIGEPQGVRTVVFDLIVAEGLGGRALRLDAEPGEPATLVARLLLEGLGERASGSIKSLATDGIPSCWFPDLESFEASEPDASAAPA